MVVLGANLLVGDPQLLDRRLEGRPIQDLEMSYRPVELRTHIDEALSERRPIWVRDVTLLRAAGEQLSLDVQLIPLSDETGSPMGITVIFNDVTQYRQLQNDLQYANRQLETAYEELQSRMNSGVAVVDTDMRVLAWNARAEDLWGVRADEAVGSHLLNLDIGLPLDTVRQQIREHLGAAPPEPTTAVLRAVNRRGRAIDVRVTLTHLNETQADGRAAMVVMEVVEPESGVDGSPPKKRTTTS